MTIEICNALVSGCRPDWNGISAIATAAATGAALLIPVWQRNRDGKDRRAALAQSLFLKTAKIYSDMTKIAKHVEESRQLASENAAPTLGWAFFRPIISLPTPVSYTTDELALFFNLRDDAALNAVIAMDEAHAFVIATMQSYAERREALLAMLPGGNMIGLVGQIDLDHEQFLRFQPYSVQLDQLVVDIATLAERQTASAKNAVEQLQRVLKAKLGLNMRIGEMP